MSNIESAIVKTLAVKFEGNEILSVDDYDLFTCYRDLWKTVSEKRDSVRQGIIHSDNCNVNCMKLRINAKDTSDGNAQDKAIAATYGNKFIISLDCYQSGLRNRLCYEITFNDYGGAI